MVAFAVLGGCGDPVARLSKVLEVSPEPAKRKRAAVKLGRRRDRAAAPALLRALDHSDAGLAFDGDVLFFVRRWGKRLWRMDPDTGVVTEWDDITFGSGDFTGLAAVGGRLYVLDNGTREIHEFDPVSREVKRSFSIGGTGRSGSGLAAFAGPERLALTSGTKVHEIDPATGERTGAFSAPAALHGAAVVEGELHVCADAGGGGREIRVHARGGEHGRSAALAFRAVGLGGNDTGASPGTEAAPARHRLFAIDTDTWEIVELGPSTGGQVSRFKAAGRPAERDPQVRAAAAMALGPIARYGSSEVDSLARCLDDVSTGVRAAAAHALGVARDPRAAGKLVQALGDEDEGVRAEVASALGRLRSEVALAGLRQATTDPDAGVRAAALEALSASAGLEATADLQRAMADADGSVRLVAAKGLAERPGTSSAAILEKALGDRAPGVAHAAARGLVELRAAAAVPGLARVAKEFRGGLRRRAVRALGETRGDEARRALISLLCPPEGEFREEDLRTLAAAALGSGLHGAAADDLARALGDPSPAVARLAAYSLAAHGRVEAEGVRLLVEDLRSGPRRADAIDALAGLGPGAAPAVEELVADPAANAGARLAAVMVLAELRLERNVPALRDALSSKAGEIRAAAAYALGASGAVMSPDARALSLEAVWRIIDDPDRRVRLYAAYAAARLGRPTRLAALGWAVIAGSEPERHVAVRLLGRTPGPRAAEMLVRGLDAPYTGVRALAARGLARKGLGPAEVRERVVGALGYLAGDHDPGVREAAASALGEIASVESVYALAAFVGDPAIEVRLAVCRALRGARAGDGVPVAARLLNDPNPGVLAACLSAIGRMTDRSFGLPQGRAPTPEELRDAVLRAQLWCAERGRDLDGTR